VFVVTSSPDTEGFPDEVERWTLEVDKEHGGVINNLSSHDYLWYKL
jgi:hypothetical protein